MSGGCWRAEFHVMVGKQKRTLPSSDVLCLSRIFKSQEMKIYFIPYEVSRECHIKTKKMPKATSTGALLAGLKATARVAYLSWKNNCNIIPGGC